MNMNYRNALMRICVGILCVTLSITLFRAITNEIFYKRLNVNNEMTRTILSGLWGIEPPEWEKKRVDVKWAELYPFNTTKNTMGKHKPGWMERMQDKVSKIRKAEERAGSWVGDKLLGYYGLVEWKNRYDKWIGWEYEFEDISDVRRFGEKDLINVANKAKYEDIQERIQSVTKFSNFCKGQGVPFLYVQAPYKIGRQDEKYHENEWKSYANENADLLVKGLRENRVDILDIRDIIERENKDNRKLFFHTDHHWKPETALWATGLIAEKISRQTHFQYVYDENTWEASSYNRKVYKKNFLGSQGRQVTLVYAEPEDITLFYPKNETSFSLEMPSYNVKRSGDYSISYNMYELRPGDYYLRSSYAAYNYGGASYTNIVNRNNPNGKHIVLVKDSFGDAVAMFLAQTVHRLEVVDLRSFDGSVQSLVEKNKPDAVVVVYNPSLLGAGAIKWATHRDPYDFR